MKKYPKISIITPSLNQGQYIEQTILSVLEQNYPNLEYIIIDGGSTDNTVEIIKKYEKHILFWVSEKDKGQSHAINKGLKLATGDIINWINSDDYYEPGVFELLNKYFNNSQINVVCGRSRIFINDNTLQFTSGTDVYKDNIAKTIGWARIDQAETFFRKNAFDNILPINNSLHYIMDRDLWIRYLIFYGLENVYKTSDVFVNFRHHESSKTISLAKNFNKERNTYFRELAGKAGLTEIQQTINNYVETFDNTIEININVCQKQAVIYASLNYFILLLGYEAYEKNEFKKVKFFFSVINKNVISAADIKRMYYTGFKLKIMSPGIKFFFNTISKYFKNQ